MVLPTGATYCGAPPLPGSLAARFNLDPVLIAALALILIGHCWFLKRAGRPAAVAAAGWTVAALAFCSPLCALSVSLFSARIAQHMILMIVAAPMIAHALPTVPEERARMWSAAALYFLTLWFWHMPGPYEATFRSTAVYWTMHVTLFGSAIWLWRGLLWHRRDQAGQALLAGAISSMQMGLLGAVIALASYPMYRPHHLTTEAWGMSPLSDQQLGGVLMWVPGCLLFLWVAIRSIRPMTGVLRGAGA